MAAADMTDVSIAGGAVGSLEISIDDPVTQGDGMSAYTSYKVNVKSTMPVFTNTEFCVVRRFSDFVWVRDCLAHEHKGYIIPPLPDKRVVGRFDPEVVAARQRQLERFLTRVGRHPALNTSKHFVSFLQDSEEAFAAAKAAASAEQAAAKSSSGGGGVAGFFGSVGSSISSVFGANSTGSKTAEDIAFEEIDAYLVGLSAQFKNVQSHVEALAARRQAMADSCFQFGLAFTLLGRAEADTLGHSLSALGKTADQLSLFSKKHARNESFFFEEPLLDYMRIVESVRAALQGRADMRAAHQQKCNELESKRAAAQRLVGVSGKESQLAVARSEVAMAQNFVDKAKAELDEVSTRVLEEVERFKREKLADFKDVLLDYVQLQIDYNSRLEQTWNELMPQLEAAQLREARVDGAVSGSGGPAPMAATPIRGTSMSSVRGAGAGAGAAGAGAGAGSAPPAPPTTAGSSAAGDVGASAAAAPAPPAVPPQSAAPAPAPAAAPVAAEASASGDAGQGGIDDMD